MNLSDVVGSGGGYKNKEIKTVSGTFTVPAGVFRIKLGAQGAGASGRTSPGGGSSFAGGGAGGSAGSFIAAEFDVRPGDLIDYFIGAGGVAPAGFPNNQTAGGNTYAKIGNKMMLVAFGGSIAANNNAPAASATVPLEVVSGGFGGGIGSGGNNGESGGLTRLITLTGFDAFLGALDSTSPTQRVLMQADNILPVTDAFALNRATGGSASSNGGAGGGGSSYFGRGGHAGNFGSPGQDAPSTHYGAGGGGGGGATINNFNLGGSGANGCMEIWY